MSFAHTTDKVPERRGKPSWAAHHGAQSRQLANPGEMNLEISKGGEGEEGPAPTEDGPSPLVPLNYTPSRQRAQRSSSSSNLLHAGGGRRTSLGPGSPPPAPRRRSSIASTG